MLSLQYPSKHIALITLQREAAMNALNQALLVELKEEIKEVSQNEDVWVLILTAQGDKAFCAGADLKERMQMTHEETREFLVLINEVVNAAESLLMPTIAALNGIAFGGGLELALACDFRIASSNVKVGLTECGIGVIPGAGGTQRLSRLIGLSKAKDMIFCARRLDAKTALTYGVIDYIVGEDKNLLEEVIAYAQNILKQAPLAVRAAKTAIQNGYDLSLDNGLALESECYERVLYTQDRLEGLKAFQEKRSPVFKGI